MFLGVSIERAGEVGRADALGLGVLRRSFLVAAVVCFANPNDTFAGLADMLGFLSPGSGR